MHGIILPKGSKLEPLSQPLVGHFKKVSEGQAESSSCITSQSDHKLRGGKELEKLLLPTAVVESGHGNGKEVASWAAAWAGQELGTFWGRFLLIQVSPMPISTLQFWQGYRMHPSVGVAAAGPSFPVKNLSSGSTFEEASGKLLRCARFLMIPWNQ